MGFLLGLLTVILFLDCAFLVFLILLQLPKKEAGAGTAFGGAATDALFGAGSGNVLTKATQYAATIFFILALVLSIMNANRARDEQTRIREALSAQTGNPVPGSTVSPAASSTNPVERVQPVAATNMLSTASNKAPNLLTTTLTNVPGRAVASNTPVVVRTTNPPATKTN